MLSDLNIPPSILHSAVLSSLQRANPGPVLMAEGAAAATLLDGLRSGEHGWRNIPVIIRASFAQIADAQASLSSTTQNLAALVTRKAAKEEVAADIAGCATQAQLQHLIEVVKHDVLPRFDSPCAGHGGTNSMLAAISARLAQLESVVSAQDRQIQALSREVRGVSLHGRDGSFLYGIHSPAPRSSPARRPSTTWRPSRARHTSTTA